MQASCRCPAIQGAAITQYNRAELHESLLPFTRPQPPSASPYRYGSCLPSKRRLLDTAPGLSSAACHWKGPLDWPSALKGARISCLVIPALPCAVHFRPKAWEMVSASQLGSSWMEQTHDALLHFGGVQSHGIPCDAIIAPSTGVVCDCGPTIPSTLGGQDVCSTAWGRRLSWAHAFLPCGSLHSGALQKGGKSEWTSSIGSAVLLFTGWLLGIRTLRYPRQLRTADNNCWLM